jgi:hypothetical protein
MPLPNAEVALHLVFQSSVRSAVGDVYSCVHPAESKPTNIYGQFFPVLEVSAKLKTKLHGLSPRANYTDRATAACQRSDCQLLRIEGAKWSACQVVSVTDPYGRILGFLDRSRYFSIK